MENDSAPILTRKQSAIVAFLFEKVDLGQKVDTLDLRLRGDFSGRFLAAHSKFDDDLTVVFTLPTYSDSVFFGVAKASPLETASVLANLEDYERDGGVLRVGEAVCLPDESKRHPQIHAVLLLPAATLVALKAVPFRTRINESEIKFALAVPLSVGEYEYRRSHGHDSLIDRLQAEGKSFAIL